MPDAQFRVERTRKMPSSIKINLASQNAQDHLNSAQSAWHNFFQKICSGLRLNTGKPNSSKKRGKKQYLNYQGVACSTSDSRRHGQSDENILECVQTNMARMLELAVQGANATTEEEIAEIDAEFTKLLVRHFSSS